jgi:sugar lactone lactonase YvrE
VTKRSPALGLSAKAACVWSIFPLVLQATSAADFWKATALTSGGFTGGIEGPACGKNGTLYCVSYQDARNLAEVTPDGRASVFVSLPVGSAGNGIRFNPAGTMFVADYTGHNVLRINPATRTVSVLVHEARMNQPNDLAIAEDGTLYASDPDWKRGTGQVWRITKEGEAVLEEGGLGTTNGIEVSPDGKSVYVNESIQRNLWVYDRAADGSLSHRRLLRKFEDHGFDGMRCDIDGNLFITRPGKGTVVKVSPKGEILRELSVLGDHPTNLCFGGNDGCTVYVTEASEKRVVQFRVDRPGLEWARWQSPASKTGEPRTP